MAEPSRITISKRNRPFTWCSDFVVVARNERERRKNSEFSNTTRSTTPAKSPDSERNAQSPAQVTSWPTMPTDTTLAKLVTLSSLINQRIHPKRNFRIYFLFFCFNNKFL